MRKIRGRGSLLPSKQLGSSHLDQWVAFCPYRTKDGFITTATTTTTTITTHISSVFTFITLFVPIPIVAADFRME